MNTQKPQVKRRRGGHQYLELLRSIAGMNRPVANPFPVLGNECWAGHYYLELRAKFQRKPDVSLSAAVIVVARQDELLTKEQFENELRTIHYDKALWNAAIDILFERIMGRKPDRSRQAIGQEASLMWDCIKLPFTEEQLHFLERAHQYRRGKNGGRDFTYEDRQKYYYQPLSFDDPQFTGKPQPSPEPGAEWDKDDFLSWMESLTDEQSSAAYKALISAIQGVRNKITPPATPEPANPEEVPADDQAAIDSAFNELMEGFDL
jgi:hypothetical protein